MTRARVRLGGAIATLGVGLALAALWSRDPARADDEEAIAKEEDEGVGSGSDAGRDDADRQIPGAPAVAGGKVLIARGSDWQVAMATSRRLPRQVAAVALGGLDVAAGTADRGVAITGDDALGAPPAAWPLGNHDHAVTATTQLAYGETARACKCDTPLKEVVPLAADERVALLWATRRFTIDDDNRDLRVLDVSSVYGDGIVVWINGVEVVRRRIERDVRPMGVAGIVRGLEWETFHIPVVPGLLRDGDNVVAVELRPAAKASGPRFDLELVGRPSAALVHGPALTAVTSTGATVAFDTDLAVEAAVEWGPTAALGTRVESARGRRHAIRLTELPVSSLVHYRVIVDGGTTPTRTFGTMPGPGEVVRIALYGDSREGHQIHRDLVDLIRADDPHLVIGTGDIVVRGSDEGEWQRFFHIVGELAATVPYYSAEGNHDTGSAGDSRRHFADVFMLPPVLDGAPARPASASWASFDAGDVHIVLLDSNAYESRAQLEWLELDLKDARKRGAKVIIGAVHDGPFSRGSHGGNAYAAEHYVPVLAKYDTTLLFSGHDHTYQRGSMGGLDYVVSGGGGASLYPLRCGAPGKRGCKVEDGMEVYAKEHHYVLLTIYPTFAEMCPKLRDGTPLEECQRYKIRKRTP